MRESPRTAPTPRASYPLTVPGPLRAIVIVLAVFVAGSLAPCARAASPDPPRDAIAWWWFDPARFGAATKGGPERAAMMSVLRAMVASGVVGDESRSRFVEGLLAAGEVGAWPHTLCLLDFAAHRPPAPPGEATGLDIDRLQMVLELRSGADHRQFLRTIKAILIDGARAAPQEAGEGEGSQRKIELPGGRAGVAYSEPGWPEWRELSWVSDNGAFLIGLGHGALERWFAAREAPAETGAPAPAWATHERLVDSERPAGEVFFEAYMDLDALRRGFPEAFVDGRAQRVLDTLRLSNARDFMMHGRWIDAPSSDKTAHAPLIAIDASWSARSERPGVVHRRAFSESSWPGSELAMAPPPGSYIIVMKAEWRPWFDVCVSLAQSFTKNAGLAERRALVRSWWAKHGEALLAYVDGLKPWLVLSDTPTPIVPIPGATTAFAEFWPVPGEQDVEGKLADLLSDFGYALSRDDAGVWWLKMDRSGAVRIPSWGFAGAKGRRALVVGWGPPAVLENRERMK